MCFLKYQIVLLNIEIFVAVAFILTVKSNPILAEDRSRHWWRCQHQVSKSRSIINLVATINEDLASNTYKGSFTKGELSPPRWLAHSYVLLY
jgi:hypothetical protein